MEAIIFDAVIVLTLCCPRFNHTLQLQNYKTRQYPEVCGILLCRIGSITWLPPNATKYQG